MDISAEFDALFDVHGTTVRDGKVHAAWESRRAFFLLLMPSHPLPLMQQVAPQLPLQRAWQLNQSWTWQGSAGDALLIQAEEADAQPMQDQTATQPTGVAGSSGFKSAPSPIPESADGKRARGRTPASDDSTESAHWREVREWQRGHVQAGAPGDAGASSDSGSSSGASSPASPPCATIDKVLEYLTPSEGVSPAVPLDSERSSCSGSGSGDDGVRCLVDYTPSPLLSSTPLPYGLQARGPRGCEEATSAGSDRHRSKRYCFKLILCPAIDFSPSTLIRHPASLRDDVALITGQAAGSSSGRDAKKAASILPTTSDPRHQSGGSSRRTTYEYYSRDLAKASEASWASIADIRGSRDSEETSPQKQQQVCEEGEEGEGGMEEATLGPPAGSAPSLASLAPLRLPAATTLRGATQLMLPKTDSVLLASPGLQFSFPSVAEAAASPSHEHLTLGFGPEHRTPLGHAGAKQAQCSSDAASEGFELAAEPSNAGSGESEAEGDGPSSSLVATAAVVRALSRVTQLSRENQVCELMVARGTAAQVVCGGCLLTAMIPVCPVRLFLPVYTAPPHSAL